jgi:3-hydroxyisobutyrate dehydrogenase-like beta-hydroxyacid dehydrogenase
MMVKNTTLGILHPGAMGITVAASAQNSGCDVFWVSEGRRAQSIERANSEQLKDAGTLDELVRICEVIVCVCPPHAAEDVALKVAASGFTGLYIDGNAISPERVAAAGRTITGSGGSFVDGGIIGGPAIKPDSTWLYLSGPEAERAAACFSEGPLEPCVMAGDIGKASALKMSLDDCRHSRMPTTFRR